MAKAKVLLIGAINHAHSAWESLGDVADLITLSSTSRANFLAECRAGTFDGVVAAYRDVWSTSITGIWDDELVDALPPSFRFVGTCAAGYDALRPEALSRRGILAANLTDAVADATADTALFLLLGALRNFNASMFALRRGEWRGTSAPALGHDPKGKLVGILGMGGIGRNLARKCGALGMRVQYYNRHALAPDQEGAASYVSFDDLLATSDVLVISVPLNAQTRHMISSDELARCKRGAVVINTARGPVVDEAALIAALDSGHIGSAGLDVFENEPHVHEGLLRNPNIMLLPHMGTSTLGSELKMEEGTISNVRAALEWLTRGRKEEGEKLSIIPEQRGLWQSLLEKSI